MTTTPTLRWSRPGLASRRFTGCPAAMLAAMRRMRLRSRGRQVPAVEGGDHGVPVDPGRQGAVADARLGVDVAGEVVAAEIDAVTDNQVRPSFVRGVGPRRFAARRTALGLLAGDAAPASSRN